MHSDTEEQCTSIDAQLLLKVGCWVGRRGRGDIDGGGNVCFLLNAFMVQVCAYIAHACIAHYVSVAHSFRRASPNISLTLH